MCGIAGIYRFAGDVTPEDRQQLQAMTAALRHRGPDGDGFFHEGPVALGHRRLAVIDLDSGQQPMCSPSGRSVISYNGEVYNYLRLRKSFAGTRFQTRSDTEVLLEVLEQGGVSALPGLNGMFAFAWYDRNQRTLLLARDGAGEKPLHYRVETDRILFASELKGILAALPERPAVDEEALAEYLRFGYVSSPRTIFQGIDKLPPGHALTVSPQGCHRIQWNHPASDSGIINADRFLEIFRDAVGIRCLSDVPLGAFLSGGVDSSAVVAMMSRGEDVVRSFSAGFAEEAYDERKYAARVAETFNSCHETLLIEHQELQQFEEISRWLDEPLADPSLLPTWQVCRLARERVTVALSGDGADELFGGYDRYRFALLSQTLSSFPGQQALRLLRGGQSVWKPLMGSRGIQLEKFLNFNLERRVPYLGAVEYFDPDTIRRCGTGKPELAMPYARLEEQGSPSIEEILAADFRYYLPEDILVKLDRSSMAVSLETRVPFLDPRIIRFARALPAREKVGSRELKIFLRHALRGILPGFVLNRPKQGFALPLREWYGGEPGRGVEDRLTASTSMICNWFDRAEISRRFAVHRRGEANFAFSLHNLNILELWARRWC